MLLHRKKKNPFPVEVWALVTGSACYSLAGGWVAASHWSFQRLEVEPPWAEAGPPRPGREGCRAAKAFDEAESCALAEAF